MPELLTGHDSALAQWVAEQIPHVGPKGFGPCSAFGVVSAGKIIAGIVYHEFQPDYGNVQISMVALNPMWARKEIISQLLWFPFRKLNVWCLYTLTPPENEKALKVNEHIGLQRKTIIPHAFGKKRHAVVCQMLEPAYRRLYEVNHG